MAKSQTTTPVAIPTIYKGIELRSRMEAQCAYLLDCLGWEWQYEPFSVMVEGVSFTPDFYVPSFSLVIECRGYESDLGSLQMSKFGMAVREGISVPGYDIRQFFRIGPDEVVAYAKGYPYVYHGARLRFCARLKGWHIQIPHDQPCAHCGEECPLATVEVGEGKIFLNGLGSADFTKETEAHG